MVTLLERDGELARLRNLFDASCNGQGRIAFVSGEAGIGKSALVSAFANEVADKARIAIGRCDALATPRGLGPLLDVAAALNLPAARDRDSLLGDLVADLRKHGSTVMVIEDAHWADDASVDLLAMLGRRVVDISLLLIVTYRDDAVSGEHPLKLLIGDLITASSTTWVGLDPLSREAVHAIADLHGIVGDDLFDRTGGNPFFVTEALAAPGEEIPTSVRFAVLARAARLEPAQRSVLDAVSIVPGQAEAWLVSALSEESDTAVAACVEAGVLTTERNLFAFRHELARLAIEADLDLGLRRALHQRAVEALLLRPGIDPARIAHHAEAAGDDETLATSARRAFLLAATRTAHREAVRHGEQALSVRQFLSADEVADLQMKLALSLMQVARSEDAEKMAGAAVDHWRSAGNDRRRAEALLVLWTLKATEANSERSMALLTEAVEVLERYGPGPELANAYIRMASAHMLARERDPAVLWGERAIALSTQLGDDALLARALIETGIADVMDGRLEGLTVIRRGTALAQERELPGLVAHGLSQMGTGCGEMRRYDEAVPALAAGLAFASHHNLESSRRYQTAWLARCNFDLGQWDDAEALARDALAGPRAVAVARFVGLNTLGWLRGRRGDDDVFPMLDEAMTIAREMNHLQRLWPNAVARAEAGWLDDSLETHVTYLEEVLGLAQRCRHGIAVGEIAMWLQRAGRLTEPISGAAEPFAAWIAGNFMGAAAGFRQMGCPYESASVLAETGDVPSLRLALATFRRLGAVPMARRVAGTLRSLGVRVAPDAVGSPAAAPRHPSGLSDRELEVLKLVTAGFTNPQIATSLYISRKTAEHHVSSILMKLGATTRSQAAATAIRLGLAG
jgi:DNA-binding CsgD family transcriptional regulator/tetratricopeptide (TPR) repeat protein